MQEQFGDLLPAAHRLASLQGEGLGDRLTRNRELQSQTPGVQWRLGPERSLLRRAGSQTVRVGKERGDN